MFVNVIGNRIVRSQRSRQEKCEFVLTNRVAHAILGSRLRARVGEALESESGFVEVGRLFGVPDIELNVVGALERKKISLRRRSLFRISNCRWHDDLLTLAHSARPLNIRSTTARRKVVAELPAHTCH